MPEQKTPGDGKGPQTPFDGDPDPGADLDSDLKKLLEERDLLFNQLARVQADFRNAQRRMETEKQQQVQYGNSSLIKSLLPVIDNFERAMEVDAAKTDSAALLKGIRIAYDQLLAVLKSQNVEPIAPEAGVLFDPNLHQALVQQPDDKYEEPTVTQLFQKGYAHHGRTLRPAQVAVSKVS